MKQREAQRRRKTRVTTTDFRPGKISVRRTKRTDDTILRRLKYAGNVQADPATYNRAFAEVLRQLADAISAVKNAWVDPEVVVWTHVDGEISAEATFSPES